MLKNLDKKLFVFAIASLIFAVGVAVGRFELFPFGLVKESKDAAIDLYRYWKSYALVEPVKYLKPARQPGASVAVHDPERAFPGLTFMTGLFERKVALQLVDMQGEVVHRWVPDFDRIWGEVDGKVPEQILHPVNEWDMMIHGAWALPDGSVILNYSPAVLLKLDKCSRPLWIRPYWTHHSVFRSEDGTFWLSGRRYIAVGQAAPAMIVPPYRDESAVQISADGEILREIPLARLLIDNGLEGLLYPTGTIVVRNPEEDFIHLNDVEVLQEADAANFPLFEAGDVMVSLRDVNLVFVFDPDSLRIKWHQTGPWLRQHDPDFLPDGTIAVFNNRRDETGNGSLLGGSNIMVADPVSGETRIVYAGNPEKPFYTEFLGKHQHLPNGNFLVTEANRGRTFEVDARGDIVWEYVNRYDEARVAVIAEATRLAEDFFTVKDWSCR